MVAEIRPQKGPQEAFLSSAADIAIYGGAAGGGKSFALLMEPLRHISNGGFGAVIFRRTSTQVRNEGGLWDESIQLYPLAGARAVEHRLEWEFASGMRVKFSHLEHEKSVRDWQGSQICLIGFDELTHFSEKMFFYLLSRNRSTCGVRPYVRATCNPDADSWVAEFIAWWIDQETGYPIPERAGKIRYFVRVDGQLQWADTAAELEERFPGIPAKSLAFYPAKLSDNPILMQKDPGYLANLLALDAVERERLLGGNWKIRHSAGLLFPRGCWKFADELPHGIALVRYWDKAGTSEEESGGKGARTAGVLGGRSQSTIYVANARAGRWDEIERENQIRTTAELDRTTYGAFHGEVTIWLEQEPGSGGKESAKATVRNLIGFDVRYERATGEKSTRWRPFAAQVQGGNVVLVRGDWNKAFIDELEKLSGIPGESGLKDFADAGSGMFHKVAGKVGPPTLTRDLLMLTPEEMRELDLDEAEMATAATFDPQQAVRDALARMDEPTKWGW